MYLAGGLVCKEIQLKYKACVPRDNFDTYYETPFMSTMEYWSINGLIQSQFHNTEQKTRSSIQKIAEIFVEIGTSAQNTSEYSNSKYVYYQLRLVDTTHIT